MGHNNLPIMPFLIVIFSGSSEELTSFCLIFYLSYQSLFLRAVDNNNIWTGSVGIICYFVGVKSQRKCLRQMMWRSIKTLRQVMTDMLRVF